jgi:hypothetical protein
MVFNRLHNLEENLSTFFTTKLGTNVLITLSSYDTIDIFYYTLRKLTLPIAVHPTVLSHVDDGLNSANLFIELIAKDYENLYKLLLCRTLSYSRKHGASWVPCMADVLVWLQNNQRRGSIDILFYTDSISMLT